MINAPKSVWRWPPAMMSMRDLFAAMRAGFDLHMSHDDRGNAIYHLSRDNISAPIGILQQSVAHRAYTSGKFGNRIALPDGRFLLKLTTRSTGNS